MNMESAVLKKLFMINEKALFEIKIRKWCAIGYKESRYESGGRIHTSTATVAIMPEAEEVDVN